MRPETPASASVGVRVCNQDRIRESRVRGGATLAYPKSDFIDSDSDPDQVFSDSQGVKRLDRMLLYNTIHV